MPESIVGGKKGDGYTGDQEQRGVAGGILRQPQLFSTRNGGFCRGACAKASENVAEILKENGGIINVAFQIVIVRMRRELNFVQLKLPGDFFDHLRLNGALIFSEGIDQGVLAEKIDDARDSQRI